MKANDIKRLGFKLLGPDEFFNRRKEELGIRGGIDSFYLAYEQIIGNKLFFLHAIGAVPRTATVYRDLKGQGAVKERKFRNSPSNNEIDSALCVIVSNINQRPKPLDLKEVPGLYECWLRAGYERFHTSYGSITLNVRNKIVIFKSEQIYKLNLAELRTLVKLLKGKYK